MCGYLGTLSVNKINTKKFIEANKLIECRGPDQTKDFDGKGLGSELLKNKNLFFIFNRLSIIDLSALASQPMYSNEFNTLLMFNGEIFNHRQLRSELESKNIVFKSNHSDTEVVLLGLSYFGINFVNKLIGQFSIAFLDFKNEQVNLIRDRLGQKPLFYSINDEELIFGSNLKAIQKIKNENIDVNSLNEYLHYGVVASPNTIYQSIFKIKPGEIATINLKNFKVSKKIYWSPVDFVNESNFDYKTFENLFIDAVKIRQEADIPIASFLSGGLDSTAIVKSLNDLGINSNTYSLGFSNKKYDESQWSDLVSKKYNTNHYKEIIKTELNQDDIITSIQLFDEPYSDPSTIPSFLISREISKSFKVAISGDGGDELLGGYLRTHEVLNSRYSFLSKFYNIYPSFLGTGNFFGRRNKILGAAYSSYFEDTKLLKLLNIPKLKNFNENYFFNLENKYKSLLLSDYLYYLPEMMMLKIDRTSMANSLEIRSPFVDHRLVEYILSTKTDYMNREINKPLINKFLEEDFDHQFLNRKKMGFVFQLEDWVYSNLNIIFDQISENNTTNEWINNLKILGKVKTRINAQRIWKIYFLSVFLNQ